ncbi:unnamed protein product [Rotaria sordida]|uniref:Uncharacterized protein n=1 Tax=Rotaria sordida TaxID=392033 RepID=A0A814S117_9BILA|nr:unnamed protein product [Rotaria sordida]CAF1373429.1 unnamed protein product [Rotaria sordida]
MQFYMRQLTSKIIRIPFIKRYNYHGNETRIKVSQHQLLGINYDCASEEIVKAQRAPDIPLDLMQKRTIEEIQIQEAQQKQHQNATTESTY